MYNVNELIKRVAANNQTNPEEVLAEMQSAISIGMKNHVSYEPTEKDKPSALEVIVLTIVGDIMNLSSIQ